MDKRQLIIHVPVIHRGYLDFLQNQRDLIEIVYIIDQDLLSDLSSYKPDITSLTNNEVRLFLNCLGYSKIEILTKDKISHLSNQKLMMIQDDVSRSLYNLYFRSSNVIWASVFLRWDRSTVLSTEVVNEFSSHDPIDKEIMIQAYKQSDHSSDWWRQVGAVLIPKGEKVETILAYNQSLPNDHVPYQKGAVRDHLEVGEKPELSNTIHAEQKIIAEAARQGIGLEGSSLYVTHFPCAVCSKMIACSGIKRCFFAEGSSNLDGSTILKSAGVIITKVDIDTK